MAIWGRIEGWIDFKTLDRFLNRLGSGLNIQRIVEGITAKHRLLLQYNMPFITQLFLGTVKDYNFEKDFLRYMTSQEGVVSTDCKLGVSLQGLDQDGDSVIPLYDTEMNEGEDKVYMTFTGGFRTNIILVNRYGTRAEVFRSLKYWLRDIKRELRVYTVGYHLLFSNGGYNNKLLVDRDLGAHEYEY